MARGVLAAITAPTLVLQGDRDEALIVSFLRGADPAPDWGNTFTG